MQVLGETTKKRKVYFPVFNCTESAVTPSAEDWHTQSPDRPQRAGRSEEKSCTYQFRAVDPRSDSPNQQIWPILEHSETVLAGIFGRVKRSKGWIKASCYCFHNPAELDCSRAWTREKGTASAWKWIRGDFTFWANMAGSLCIAESKRDFSGLYVLLWVSRECEDSRKRKQKQTKTPTLLLIDQSENNYRKSIAPGERPSSCLDECGIRSCLKVINQRTAHDLNATHS